MHASALKTFVSRTPEHRPTQIRDLESAVVNFLVSWGNRTDHKGSVGRSHARIRAENDQLAVVVSGISGW